MMEHKHGSEEGRTEVPRTTPVSALKTNSQLFSTQSLAGTDQFFHDTMIEIAHAPGDAHPFG